MTGLFLSAWLLFPLLLIAACTGTGLLVRRLSGGALSGVLLLPVGFALTVTLCTLGTSSSSFAPHTGALVVVVAAIGFLLHLPHLRKSRHRPGGERGFGAFAYPAFAAFGAFAVIAAPVVLTGTPSWTGFGRIVDIAFQMDFSQHLAEAGRSVPHPDSSFNLTIEGLTGNGYPGGAQATLGALSGVIRMSVAWCYQPYLAVTAAMGALALYGVLRRIVPNRLICSIGAAVAMQPNILYAYALEGGIKELTTAALVLLVAAFVAEWLEERPTSVRSALPLAPSLAGAAAAFSYGALPWAGIILLGGFALSLIPRRARLRTLGAWVVAAAATTLLAIPTVISSIKLFGTAKQAAQGVIEVGLGNLTAPIPEIATFGVWISNDYRFPQFAHVNASHAVDYLVIALGIVGILGALWKRRWMVAVFGVTGPIAIAYVVAHAGPWVQLKGFTISGTFFLAMAFIGAGLLATSRPRKLALPIRGAGWLGGLAVAATVLYGNALTYHDMSFAPAARYRQLEQIGNRFAGSGRALFPEFDEYSELFLRREKGSELARPTGLQPRPGAVNLAPGQFAYAYDLNQLELRFVQSFPLLVIPRSPVASRAPANYVLADRTSEFEVWRRARPGTEVVEHLPLSGSPSERTRAYCRNVIRGLRKAGAGSLLAYVPVGPRVSLIPTQAHHPSYWHPGGPENLRAYGAGVVEDEISVPAAGTYEVSMPGSVGRPLTLYVDGRRAGSVAYQFRYPGQFLRFGRITLSAGTHRVRLVRGNGSLAPGSGDGPDAASGIVGPLVFTLEEPQNGKLLVAPARAASRICAAPVGYEWMEILRPGSVA